MGPEFAATAIPGSPSGIRTACSLGMGTGRTCLCISSSLTRGNRSSSLSSKKLVPSLLDVASPHRSSLTCSVSVTKAAAPSYHAEMPSSDPSFRYLVVDPLTTKLLPTQGFRAATRRGRVY